MEASSALIHLGETADQSLPLAKQTIDILAMLEEKTKGNLRDVEAQLVASLLYDPRVKYVDAQKAAART